MNVLQINTRFIGGGGAANIANLLHISINKTKGYSSSFLYGRGIEGDSKSKRIIFRNMEYISAFSYRFIGKEVNFNRNIEEFIVQADVIHLHNLHGYYINYSKLFKLIKKYNKPVIWTLHDMWPITGRCAYTFGCNKWKDSCERCEKLDSYPKTKVDRACSELKKKMQVINSINAEQIIIVTPSRWLANVCKESYLNKFKIINIPNGIEHIEVKSDKANLRKKYKIPLNKKVILFVAADISDPRKGMNYILDIIPKCMEYYFVAVGKKIEKIRYDNLLQLGYISDKKCMNEIYSLSDIFIITSIDENFPTTVIEAFSNSTPVVGFNVGGISEQIINDSGIVIKNLTSSELKKAIETILKDESKLKAYSINARKRYNLEYTQSKFISRYKKIYNEVTKGVIYE